MCTQLRFLMFILCWACTASLAWAQGVTVAIGGALQDNNDRVWSRMVELAGGPGARFAVLATAAGDPERSAARIISNLSRHGAVGVHVPVAPQLAGIDIAQAVQDPRWLAELQSSQGVFFSGGAQARLLDSLQAGGQRSPLLQAVHALWLRGGVVAGTSSGAAVLSEVAFRDVPDPLAAMKSPATRLRNGHEVGQGFGFLPAGLVVDQHFIRRGRIARLLPLMTTRGLKLGIGIEEDTAIVVRGNSIDVIGAAGALVVDLHDAESAPPGEAFVLRNARLHWLQDGDSYDLRERLATPSAAKQAATALNRTDPGFSPYYTGVAHFNDILADGVLIAAMARLVDSDQSSVNALSFDIYPQAAANTEDTAPTLGFMWRFSVAPGTRGWYAGAANYSLIDVALDVLPVRMASPLFQPWVAPAPQQSLDAVSRPKGP